jgi:hypothetical protein
MPKPDSWRPPVHSRPCRSCHRYCLRDGEVAILAGMFWTYATCFLAFTFALSAVLHLLALFGVVK